MKITEDYNEHDDFLKKRNDKKIEKQQKQIGIYIPFRIGGGWRLTFKKFKKLRKQDI